MWQDLRQIWHLLEFGALHTLLEEVARLPQMQAWGASVGSESSSVRDPRTMAKTILVTGASSGFGRLTAETLSKSGHKVFAGFRSAEGARKQIADELKAKNIEILKVDVTTRSRPGQRR